MDEILADALAGADGAALEAAPLPTTYRAAYVRREDASMFDGVASEDKDPRKSIHLDEVPLPELAPDEAYVAVMASSINFNTVWTAIFEPLPTFGFLRRRRRRRARRLRRPGLEARRPRHGPLQPRRRSGPDRARRLDARVEPAHLGLRDELRWSRRALRGQGQPADAQSRAPDVGGGGRQRAHELHQLPDAREPQRRADGPGADGAHLGRQRRHRRVRVPVRAERRWDAGRRGVESRAGATVARDGRRARRRPQGRGVPLLVRRAHTGPGRM